MPEVIKASFQSLLELKFYDVEDAEQLGPEQTIKRIPERRDIRGVIEFFRKTRADASGYTIHCWQGISRSPAVALGLLYMLTGSEALAEEELIRLRPGSRPHKRLVGFFDDELGCHLFSVNDEIHKKSLDAMRKDIESLLEREPKGLLARARLMESAGRPVKG
jgi:predicted protein tyrosine phosphatase